MITRTVVITLFTVLLISCAHQSAPGGGPEDTKPPELSVSFPENGQTSVDPQAPITITFSKWINLSGIGNSITVYPVLPAGFSVKAAKNWVKITPQTPLSENTTYHVVLGTNLKDIRGNTVTRPINLVFSTGAFLDSAQLSGSVVSLEPLITLPKVALYREYEEWSDTSYFSAPDYMTQCDSGGVFHFSHLREGKYRIVAFNDPNRVGRLRAGEPCFTSLGETILINGSAGAIKLYPAESDTLHPKINSIKAVDMHTLRGSWNKKYDSQRYRKVEWKITELSANASLIRIRQTTMLANGTEFYLTLQDALKSGAYLLSYSYSDISDSLRFNGSALTDTLRPALRSHSPSGRSNLSPELRLAWNKPVRISQGMITAVSADSSEAEADSVSFFFTDKYSDTTLLTPSKMLKPGLRYRISLQLQSIKDINGNVAASVSGKDSTEQDSSINVFINTISEDSLCYRLHGGAKCLDPESKRKWVYLPRGRNETYIVPDKSGSFSFDSIPASKGKIYWFIDENNDNILTTGRLTPWRAPERFVIVPDSVEARARWEIENLQVNACEGD
ncbi:MAG: Ig-like domain-containing protein [Chitinispirillales bacterium]|jgi:hypothetical protein|nr:Ig-like domain-containing protein [Chitinispirillales bacterium]